MFIVEKYKTQEYKQQLTINMARWIVWFAEYKDGAIDECCGSDSTFPVDGRKTVHTIIRDIRKSGAYKYRNKHAIGFKIYQGDNLLFAKPVTDLIRI